ncbi:putative metal-binding motif-containing protein [Thermodesulfobacteriota bacterium]
MVLANGQYMFTCSGDGSFNLDVPLDPDTGQITVFAFCEGLAPFEQVIYPAEGHSMQIEMAAGEGGSGMDVTSTLTAINTTWVRIEGTVSYNGSPVCAMVLANGQYMFTCSGDGTYSLDVPLNPDDGSVTLFSFCSGLPPYKYVYTSDQISFNDDTDGDGYPISQGDCSDFDAGINPGAIEICGDDIDQDCNGVDAPCQPGGQSYSASGTYTYGGNILTVNFITSDFPEDDGPPPGHVVQVQILSITETTMMLRDDENELQTWHRNQGQSRDIVGNWTRMDDLEMLVLDIKADGTFSYTVHLPSFTVPYGTITIDGNFDDWKSSHRVYVDTNGPDCSNLPGLDLKEVYLAQDETFIYLRFVLNGLLDATYGYKLGNVSRHISVRYIDIVYANGLGLPQPKLPSSFYYIDGNQFECKFYKSDVEGYWNGGYGLWAGLSSGSQTACRDNVDMPILDFGF